MPQFTLPRVYPILDTVTLDRLGLDCITAAEALIEGGARILQIRHKSFWSRETFTIAEQISALCRSANVLFVVNDRADYAAILNAALHLGQEDLTPADARRVIGPSAILGYSTHNPDQMRAAENDPVDYLAFGPVFATVSKERPDPTVGIAGLKAVRALTPRPLVAIGGITRDNAVSCWNAGADSVAVIADLYPNPCTKITLRDRMTEWQKPDGFVKGLGLLDATTLVMGSMIGSGIFIVSADVARQVKSPGLLMICWLVARITHHHRRAQLWRTRRCDAASWRTICLPARSLRTPLGLPVRLDDLRRNPDRHDRCRRRGIRKVYRRVLALDIGWQTI